tara:strand:+ start:486 stop:1595 length:1110 start_codon:yes stop_codon:yes gene_type:complete
MNNNDYQIYFDCGFSKLRTGAINIINSDKAFYTDSKFFLDQKEIDTEIQKIITTLEKDTNQYIDNINLMIDSPRMISIGISISKKIDESQLRQEDIQFLVQEAKQQILKNYNSQNIVHIIINNYKINNVNYDYLPKDIKCNFISLDIIFICLPEEIIKYFKSFFYKFNISINRIICSSYAKAINYKDNFSLYKNISFIDVGFNKTSITTYIDNKITSMNVIPIGGNNITKDISKLLKIDLVKAENLKIDYNKNKTFLSNRGFSLKLLHEIIFARTDEILKICIKLIKLDFFTTDLHKIILMGEGSKILYNLHKDNVNFLYDVDFLEETTKDVCQSGFKLSMGLNKQEVLVIPKKQIQQGFFEKLFHLFK